VKKIAAVMMPVKSLAIVTVPGTKAMIAEDVDISAVGVCMTLPSALEVGRCCKLDLEIDEGEKRSTTVLGRVCFCMKSHGGFRVGFNCALDGFAGSVDGS
jgi:hypothetical protein